MTFIVVGVVFVLLAMGFSLDQASKERKQREVRMEQCHIVESVEVFNSYHNGVGSILWGELEDGTRIKTSPIELILNDGNVIETRSGSRYVLR